MKFILTHKKILVIFFLVSPLIFLLLWFTPLSLGQRFSQEYFDVSVITQDDTVVDNFTLVPHGNIETFKITSSSVAHQSLLNVLKNMRYSKCFHTIMSDWFSPTGKVIIRISTTDYVVYLSTDVAHIVVNGEIYRINTPSNLYEKCLEVINSEPDISGKLEDITD